MPEVLSSQSGRLHAIQGLFDEGLEACQHTIKLQYLENKTMRLVRKRGRRCDTAVITFARAIEYPRDLVISTVPPQLVRVTEHKRCSFIGITACQVLSRHHFCATAIANAVFTGQILLRQPLRDDTGRTSSSSAVQHTSAESPQHAGPTHSNATRNGRDRSSETRRPRQ